MIRDSIVTKKGTKLPLMNIKGKEYLAVAQRVRWFREEHPDYTIRTSLEHWDKEKKWCVAKAQIATKEGVLLAEDYKSESAASFSDYIEKSITGAVGRALALCGYGTAHAPEMEEGERIVDAPQEPF